MSWAELRYSQVPNKREVPIIRGMDKLSKCNKRGGVGVLETA